MLPEKQGKGVVDTLTVLEALEVVSTESDALDDGDLLCDEQGDALGDDVPERVSAKLRDTVSDTVPHDVWVRDVEKVGLTVEELVIEGLAQKLLLTVGDRDCEGDAV